MNLTRLFRSSPRQTFMLFPALAVAGQLLLRGRVGVRAEWLPLLLAGYALYRFAGAWRLAGGAASRGFAESPRRLVTDGPYALSRNPMYLGHLLFLVGLVAATRSPIAVALLVRQWARFDARVREDEARLEEIFGADYARYRVHVPRWLPRPPDALHGGSGRGAPTTSA